MQRNVRILLFWIITSVFGADQGPLVSLVKVFRHGARTPIFFYPTDPYSDPKYWNGLGHGALTEKGKEQLHTLGQYFKQKYGNFVGDVYDENTLSVRSASSERNIESAKSFLEGYFNEEIDIPIEKAPTPIFSAIPYCLKYEAEYLKLESRTPELVEFNNHNKDMYKYIGEKSGFPVIGLTTGYEIWDILTAEKFQGLTLPQWTESVFPENLTTVSDMFGSHMCANKELQMLGLGPFLTILIDHFDNIVKGHKEPKTILYSAHDLNLACYLDTFGYYLETKDHHLPPFASSMTFELRQNDENGHYLNVYYKPYDEAVPVTIKGCDFDCNWNQFKQLYGDLKLSKTEWYFKCAFIG